MVGHQFNVERNLSIFSGLIPIPCYVVAGRKFHAHSRRTKLVIAGPNAVRDVDVQKA
jgi:hypothetical protein